MLRRVAITAYGNGTVQDFRGLDGQKSIPFATGDVKYLTVTATQWESLRTQLTKLSQDRLNLIESGVRTTRTKPLITYTVELVPGGRPRVHQLEGVIGVSAADPTTQTLVMRGENLIAGLNAFVYLKKGTTSQLLLTATRKGPVGNRVSVKFLSTSSATPGGSITVTPDNLGGASIIVLPAVADPGANAIALQMANDAECSRYVTAVGGGTGTVGPIDYTSLAYGDGAGQAYADIRTLVSTAYLRLEATRPGNQGNAISVRILAAAGPGSVTVSLANRTISIVPAAAADTLTGVAAQIVADADASSLVVPTIVGVGGTATKLTGWTFLHGGAGEEPVATVGGATATITAYTDTAVTVSVTKAALLTAGVIGGDRCLVNLLNDYGVTAGGTITANEPRSSAYPVRVATAAVLAAYTRTANVITANGNGIMADVDGVTLVAGDRLLLKDGAAGQDNGIYVVTSVGTAGTPFVLTRAGDMDASAKVIPGMTIAIQEGTVNLDKVFQLTTNAPITLNTTALTFALLSGVAHAASHVTGGGDTIASAVAGGNAGLMTGADKTKLDTYPASPSGGDALRFGNSTTLGGAPATSYLAPCHMEAASDATERFFIMTRAGTMNALYAYSTGHAEAGQTATLTVRKNGVDTTILVAYASGESGAKSDVAHTATFVAGDRISVKCVATHANALLPNISVSLGYLPT